MSLRLSTKSNPLGLQLGEWIVFNRVCAVEYDEDSNKVLKFKEETSPHSARVIGVVKKATGKYIPRKCSGYYLECDTPPFLKVDKYHWLYECRAVLDSEPFLVHPDDIEAA